METNTQNSSSSPAQVAEQVKIALRRRGTLKEAATLLGVSPNTLSTQLANAEHSYMSQRIASRMANAFGFDIEFLTTGSGSLNAVREPRNLYGLGGGNSGSVEERVVSGVRAQLLKLNELAWSYNNLIENIREVAGYISPGGEGYDYCQAVLRSIEGITAKQVNVD